MISEITKYIKNYSSSAIRLRAKDIEVKFESKAFESYHFSYQGTARKSYKIIVNVGKKDVKSSCSCPYDFVDVLCKHEVAALNYVIDQYRLTNPTLGLFKDENEIFDDYLNLENNFSTIILDLHKITNEHIEIIAKRDKIYHLQPRYVEVLDFKEGYAKTNYAGWPNTQQEFNYNADNKTLTATCECEVSKTKQCTHILSALTQLIISYGEDVFNPNYIEKRKEEFLSQYGLSLKDNYQKFFEFSFSIKGLEVIEKVKNIQPSAQEAKDVLIPQFDKNQKDSLLVRKKNEISTATHGIGFCLDIGKHQGFNSFYFYPFKGKFKKYSNEFASSFKEIDIYSFVSQLKDTNANDKQVILQALEFIDTYKRNKDFNVYRDSFIAFNELLDSTTNYQYFFKNYKASLTKKNLSPLKISKDHPELSFKFTEKEDFFTLKPTISIGNSSYQINSTKLKVFPLFCMFNDTIYKYKTPYEYLFIAKFRQKSEVHFLKHQYKQLYNQFLKPISEYFEIKTEVYKISKNTTAEENLKKQVYLSDYEGEFILFKLGVQYDDKLVMLHTKENLFSEETQTISSRNEIFESEFIEDFKELHPDFNEQEDVYLLSPVQLIEDEWLIKASEKMKQSGIAIFGAKDLKSFKFNLNKPAITMSVKSETDWFDLQIEIKYGNQKVGLKEVKKAILKKSKYVALSDGTLGVLPEEWLKKFANYLKVGEVKNNEIKISNYQFNIIDELYEEIENAPKFLNELQQKKERLLNLKKVKDVAVPKAIKARLRPYQQEGLNWLNFLDENELGGCLADDMGLGKTLQVISFLAHLKANKKTTLSNLVIAPTSLIFNWQNEIEKFCPSLKTIVYTGPKRESLLKKFSKSDVILTTYGSILNDIEVLKNINFGYIILDESQAIKNPNSKRFKAVRMLQSYNRLALTGTPIENNTFDLYAQMSFLNPGLLGSKNHFKNEFSDAIDKAKSEDASVLLSKMIHPFLLRRTKSQVATELPEKSETILYCEMGTEQRQIYEAFKHKYRDYLLQKIDENGAAKSQIYVLEGLTKLRQICNSPELLNDEEDYGKSSIKLDILIDNIKTKTAKHKVLVFSQFTSMLKLIKDRLDNENIAYEYLDGQTRKREEKVTNFQETEELRVFLISLKAGGVGLNLTAADYVFLVDPWWNPAVESQAIDRSHRIGQTKHVMAYKMICKNTIEEKIVDLQKNKRQVSNSVIQIDSSKKSFNTKEIKELFN